MPPWDPLSGFKYQLGNLLALCLEISHSVSLTHTFPHVKRGWKQGLFPRVAMKIK